MSKHPTGRGSDQFVVRFPDGMRDEIRRAAEASGRSMNAEIIARLEDSFKNRTESSLADLQAVMNDAKRMIKEFNVANTQISLMRYLLDQVAATDGKLPEDLHRHITILSQLGGPSTREGKSLSDLVSESIEAMREMESGD